MKRIIGIFFILLSPLLWREAGDNAFAQITADPDTNISLCNPICVTLKAKIAFKDTIRMASSYKVDSIPFYSDSISAATTKVTGMGFKVVKGPFPIGFTFNFFGECYTQFYIGPGWIGFSSGQTGNRHYYLNVTPLPIPDTTSALVPKNIIMLSWSDLEGSVYYQTFGTAPYRRLAVTWNKVDGPESFNTYCSETDTNGTQYGHLLCKFSGQIIIYETTNVIENYILSKPLTDLKILAVEGLHNKDGTKAVVVPGRNSTWWPDTLPSMRKDGWRFSPTGPIAAYKLAWYKDTTLIASDTTQVSVCPIITTSYTAKVIYTCPPDTFSDNATITVSGNSFNVNAGNDSAICKGKSVTLQATGGTKTSYSWTPTASLSNPQIATPVATPAVTTSYIVAAYDTVCGNSNKDTVVITVDSVKAIVAGMTSICKGQNATLTAYGGVNYLWSTGSTATTSSITVAPLSTASYTVTVSTGRCPDTATATVVVNNNPVAFAWSDTTITAGSSATLTASGGGTYLWSNGVTNTSITVIPAATTIYCVAITDIANGCSDNACVTVIVEPITIDCSNTRELFLPNAFSPNGDGENDTLRIYYGNFLCIKDFRIAIYDRWGEIVFQSTEPAFKWEGTQKGKWLDPAVFAYYLNVTFLDEEKINRKGNISLLR